MDQNKLIEELPVFALQRLRFLLDRLPAIEKAIAQVQDMMTASGVAEGRTFEELSRAFRSMTSFYSSSMDSIRRLLTIANEGVLDLSLEEKKLILYLRNLPQSERKRLLDSLEVSYE